jgi:hypothetical protein
LPASGTARPGIRHALSIASPLDQCRDHPDPGAAHHRDGFRRWDGISTPTFVGLDNFRTIFADPVFFSALLNNVKWTLIFLVVPIAMGLLADRMLLVVRRGRTFFQIVYFLPVIIATSSSRASGRA